MKFQQTILILLIFSSIHPCLAPAQTAKPVEQHPAFDSISFPPLSMMIDSALAHNAMLKYYEQGILAKKISLKMESKMWTKSFGLQADVRYGTFDNFSTNTASGQTPSLLSTKTSQTNYGVGAFFKLPVSDLVTRKSQLQLTKTEVDQAQRMAEVQRDQVRQIIIRQYNEVILKQSLLKIKAKNLESSRLNMVMAEKEFLNGNMTLGTYSSISETAGNTEINFEEARVDFKTAYMILEELVGFKFNIKIQ